MGTLRISRLARRAMAAFVRGAGDSRVVRRAAARQARAPVEDEEARRQLEDEIFEHRAGIPDALRVLRATHGDFVTDRALRLLTAIACDAPVEPIAADNAELFRREEMLGRMAVVDAYLRLAEIEPRLHKVAFARDAPPQASNRSVKRPTDEPYGRELHTLVGPCAQHSDPLIRSELALSLASHYLSILTGKLPRAQEAEPYFSAQRRVVVRSGALTGPDPQSAWPS